jgi:hypothetical protein
MTARVTPSFPAVTASHCAAYSSPVVCRKYWIRGDTKISDFPIGKCTVLNPILVDLTSSPTFARACTCHVRDLTRVAYVRIIKAELHHLPSKMFRTIVLAITVASASAFVAPRPVVSIYNKHTARSIEFFRTLLLLIRLAAYTPLLRYLCLCRPHRRPASTR